MKKLLIALVIVFVVVLILLVAGGFYAYSVLKPFLISSSFAVNTNQEVTNTNQTPIDKNPLLTPSQEATLEKIGIDPAKLPTTITPTMEACFVEKIGVDRVEAIKSGTAPTTIDLFKVKSCL